MRDHEFPNLLEIFIDIAKQAFRRRMFTLHFFENFNRRFGRIDSPGGVGESFLFFAQLSQANLENFLGRKVDKFGLFQDPLELFFAEREVGGGFWQFVTFEPGGIISQGSRCFPVRLQKFRPDAFVL